MIKEQSSNAETKEDLKKTKNKTKLCTPYHICIIAFLEVCLEYKDFPYYHCREQKRTLPSVKSRSSWIRRAGWRRTLADYWQAIRIATSMWKKLQLWYMKMRYTSYMAPLMQHSTSCKWCNVTFYSVFRNSASDILATITKEYLLIGCWFFSHYSIYWLMNS